MSKIYFFTDIHADRDAFLRSFDRCEDKKALFLIGGDSFDKGPSNLDLIEEYKSLIDSGIRMEFLIGNHDLRQLMVLKHWNEQTEEIYAPIFTKKRFERRIWPFLDECGGIKAAKSMFLDENGEFYWFFERHKLLKIVKNCLFSHAGVDNFMAFQLNHNGEKSVNFIFKSLLERNSHRAYYGEFGPTFRGRLKNTDLTQKGANYLKHAGIEYVIHGHVSVFKGHQLNIVEGVKHIMCDCIINQNSRKKHNIKTEGWAYLDVDFKKNKIIGFSSEGTVYFN